MDKFKNNFSLVINSSNSVGTGNNTYQYNFLTGSMNIPENAVISISSATIPYSWRNITQRNNNNVFNLYWPNGASYTTYTITIPDGFYSVATLQAFIEQFCITNGLYLIDNTGAYIYYINFSINQTFYAVQILTFLVPVSLPATWSQPSNWAGYPITTTSPGIGILNNNFGSIIGYLPGDYPASFVGTVSDSFLSNTTVNATPVNSLVIRTSLCSNNVVFPSDILDSISINATYGSNIIYEPSFEKIVKIKKGIYSNFNIVLCDQNYNLVNALDNNILINLRISF